ncbi:nuclear distribution protein nudE-like [Miscanthus floridulus]|uniref:nuclear distribution protein nudE-like n=1 Tax=Miscanthus floridulus TaxID=154761 RepID=UPI003457FA0A
MAQEQVTPLAAWVKELEEELTRVAGDRDAFWSRAEEATTSSKALTGQLGAEQGAHLLAKGALAEALKCEAELEKEASRAVEASRVEVEGWKEKAEASRVETQHWKEKAEASRVEAQRWEEKTEELEKEVTRVAEASIAVQVVLEAEIGEHDALKSAARTVCEALERALAVISSHYAGIDLKAISDGYVLLDDDKEADKEVAKLMESAEGPGTALAKLFEEEVVPPPPSADAGDLEP